MTAPAGVLVSHPTMNTNVREAARSLADAGLLAELHTSIAVGPRLSRAAATVPRVSRLVERRRVPAGIEGRTRSHPAYELRFAAARRSPAAARLLRNPSLHGMYAAFDDLAARRVHAGLGAVLAYEDGAEATFAAAAKLGLPRVYDLPIPFWRTTHALLEAEKEANPAWAPLLGALGDPRAVLERKERELAAADLVLTASSLSTLSVRDQRPDVRLAQITYGCPDPAADVRPSAGGPLRALYVGSLTQRKGLSYVFDALDALGPDVTLTVVGSGAPAPSAVLDAALARHRHVRVVPHPQMAAMMRAHDVLLLPSLVEGFGLVINEALAQGLPVIATDRTGAVDLYGPEAADWLVPVADSGAIATILERWARDTDALNEAKTIALAVARRHTWAAYRAGLLDAVRSVL